MEQYNIGLLRITQRSGSLAIRPSRAVKALVLSAFAVLAGVSLVGVAVAPRVIPFRNDGPPDPVGMMLRRGFFLLPAGMFLCAFVAVFRANSDVTLDRRSDRLRQGGADLGPLSRIRRVQLATIVTSVPQLDREVVTFEVSLVAEEPGHEGPTHPSPSRWRRIQKSLRKNRWRPPTRSLPSPQARGLALLSFDHYADAEGYARVVARFLEVEIIQT